MYYSRPVARSPSVVRVVRPAAAKCGRQASFLSQPFLHRSPGAAIAASNDFAPFFRLFDDLTGPIAPQFRQHNQFQPRFDVREVGDQYELRGELPGVEGKDIEVEFSDPQTLIIRGRTEKETSSGTPPSAAAESTETQTAKTTAEEDNLDAASTYSTGSYQKPSVEDEGAEQATPNESNAENIAEPTKTTTEEPKEQTQATRYWISERSTGSFQRVFNFESRIDQDAVKASLKNGILSIVVPKAAVPAAKRINVE